MIENGIITTSQSKYFGTQISIAMLFEKRKECLELLKEESVDEKKSQYLCWEMFYGVSIKSKIEKLELEHQHKDFDIGSLILLSYMKIVLYEISKGFSFCNISDNFVIKSQKKYFKDAQKHLHVLKKD